MGQMGSLVVGPTALKPKRKIAASGFLGGVWQTQQVVAWQRYAQRVAPALVGSQRASPATLCSLWEEMEPLFPFNAHRSMRKTFFLGSLLLSSVKVPSEPPQKSILPHQGSLFDL